MKNIICPKCKSKNIIPIVYGYPSLEAMEASEKGLIKLGGCVILIDGCKNPDRYCKDCGNEWSVARLLSEDVIKVRFRYWSNWGVYDPKSVEEGQWAYDIYPNGTVNYKSYPLAGRRVLNKETAKVDAEKIKNFYDELLMLFKPWGYCEDYEVCDGCSYELTITYADGRKRKKKGDVGGGSIDNLVLNFIESIPQFADMDEEEED